MYLEVLAWLRIPRYDIIRDDSLNGRCYVCQQILEYDNFECGHVNSVNNGGETVLNNLEPICRKCNNDMGIVNLEDYRTLVIKSTIKNIN